MVAVTKKPLSSKWKNLSNAKWSEAKGTWKINGYSNEYVIEAGESISFVDNVSKSANNNISDSLRIDTAYNSSMKYTENLKECFGIDSSASTTRHISVKESIVLNDAIKKSLACSYKETVSIHSTTGKSIPILIEDGIGISEHKTMNPIVNIKDSVAIDTKCKAPFTLSLKESITVADSYSDRRCFNRNSNEVINVSDSIDKSINVNTKEVISFFDELVEKCNSVISNIIISTTEIETDVPAGYEPWQPFVSGDYSYKDALIKCRLSAINTNGQTLLSDYKVFVDLPDIQDHAVTKIGAEKTWIPFSQEFYQIPEVTITTVGTGNAVAIPHLVDVTLSGFYVELKTINNTLSAGTISWQALGC